MPAWGWVALAACTIAALLLGMWIGYGRGFDHGTEEGDWQREDARWKGLAEEARRPVPVRPPVPAPEPQRDGPGKHRHPAGARHAALPVAGYLAAPVDGLWGGTITMAAPVQRPPWETPEPEPAPEPEPEPQTEVLEPTAVHPPAAPDPCTDSAWTKRMADDMDRWIAEHIGATDNVLKEITR